MTSAAAVTGFILLLLSVEVVQGFWGVDCSKSSSCLFEGSTVEVNCSTEYPPGLTNKEERVFWSTKKQNGEPVDVRTDPRYKDRVSVSSGPGRHTLMITDLRESDSLWYNFRVETNFTGGTFSRETEFYITVAGVRVSVSDDPSADRPYLTCHAGCHQSKPVSFIWYKNGEEIQTGSPDFYDFTDLSYGDNLSCAVKGHEDFRSRPFLIQDQDMLKVTCHTPEVCSYKGSDVEISCVYRYTQFRPDDKNIALDFTWFTTEQDGEPVDLRTDPQYKGRLLVTSGPGFETLKIFDLRESDSAVYSIKLETNQRVDNSDGRVSLAVTDPDLQAQVRGHRSLEWAHLWCHSRCCPTERSFFIWHKNGEEIQTKASYSYHLKNFSAADSYSCALNEYKDFPSPLICVSGSSCNRVTYTDRTICAPKGSSLEISCYYNSYEKITSKFWFSPGLNHRWQNPSLPEDLSEDSQYADRVQVLETERGRSTLRIRDLRESDSADYRFKFQTQSFEWRSRLPATTVSVTGDLQVQVRRISSNQSSTYADLRCLSSCSPAAPLSYTWIRNRETDISGAETFIYKGWFSLEEEIACALKGHEQFPSPPVYAPKVPSVVLSSFGEILENSSVTLTCSSDANPEANYTWYKKNGDPDFQPLSTEAELVFSSIQSADSGEYYCEAENNLGKRTSKLFMVDVKCDLQVQVRRISSNQSSTYADLRCLSSCSPLAPLSYTWIRNRETDISGAETFIYKGWFSLEEEISCALKGHEQFPSPPVYAPKVPSVVLSSFGEILENSSVTLTCSSDANPEANYTWYKKNGDPDFQPLSAEAELVFSSIQSSDSGEYYCEAENRLGKRTSKLFMVDVKYKTTLIINVVRLALMVVILGLVLLLYLWMRTKTAVSSITEPNEPEETVELESHPDDINPSALRGVPAVQTPDTEEQETPV